MLPPELRSRLPPVLRSAYLETGKPWQTSALKLKEFLANFETRHKENITFKEIFIRKLFREAGGRGRGGAELARPSVGTSAPDRTYVTSLREARGRMRQTLQGSFSAVSKR